MEMISAHLFSKQGAFVHAARQRGVGDQIREPDGAGQRQRGVILVAVATLFAGGQTGFGAHAQAVDRRVELAPPGIDQQLLQRVDQLRQAIDQPASCFGITDALVLDHVLDQRLDLPDDHPVGHLTNGAGDGHRCFLGQHRTAHIVHDRPQGVEVDLGERDVVVPEVGEAQGAPKFAGTEQRDAGCGGRLATAHGAFGPEQQLLEILGGFLDLFAFQRLGHRQRPRLGSGIGTQLRQATGGRFRRR